MQRLVRTGTPNVGGPVTPEQERWAEALAIERLKGEQAGAYLDERIATLAERGDTAGVRRFEAIRARWRELQCAARA